MWNRFIISGEEEEEDYLLDDTQGLCSLSPLQRIYGFAAAFAAGFLLMFLSLIVFARPIKFALLLTFGNVLAVGSTAFLIGPLQQMRMMFDPVRMYATAIYIGCVVLSLITALWIHSKILTLLAIICEICALIWYSFELYSIRSSCCFRPDDPFVRHRDLTQLGFFKFGMAVISCEMNKIVFRYQFHFSYLPAVGFFN